MNGIFAGDSQLKMRILVFLAMKSGWAAAFIPLSFLATILFISHPTSAILPMWGGWPNNKLPKLILDTDFNTINDDGQVRKK